MEEKKENSQEEFVVEKQSISDEELENVAGGAECAYKRRCPECGMMCKSFNDRGDHLYYVHGIVPRGTGGTS